MTLLTVDGNSILNRAFYGIRALTTKDGRFTNAIYGFLTILKRIEQDTKPDAVAIAFDLKAPTFRHKAYSGYKAQRKGMPQELASQLEPLKTLLTHLGYKLVTCEGYEADDILGTLSLACEKSGDCCVIATGDRDSLQLVSDKTTVRLATTKEAILYDEQRIMADYGVKPKQLIEIKALQGDTSDNIPGVAGIGAKGAGDLIKRFGSIDYIYENIDTIDVKDGIRNKLKNGKDDAYMSRMLGEICRRAPVDTSISSYLVSVADYSAAVRMMADLELFSLIEKFNLQNTEITATKTEEKQSVIDVLSDNDIDFIKESVALTAHFTDNDIDYILAVTDDKAVKISDKAVICEILSDEKIKKSVYSSKELFAYSDRNSFEICGIDFDVTLAAYLLNPSSSDYDLKRLCSEYNVAIPAVSDNSLENAEEFSLVAALISLSKKLKEQIITNGQQKLLNDIEIPLARVLAEMENLGFAVDKNGIEQYGEKIGEEISSIEQEIYSDTGYEFNINSPKQLGVALFEKLGLPCKKKTKSGYSTNAEVLEELKYQHPVVAKVLRYRTLAKLKSTYCTGLLKVIAADGRIHSSFNQTETRTGRISSTEPNLQNIPVRTELGREMRRFFCAKDGCVLVDADYSQIELRVLAHISGDQNMRNAFINNEDIHTTTASQVFNLPPEMITPIMRSRAKAVNFGIVYGIGAFSLSKDIGVTNKEASNYIKSYLSHYSGVDAYMKNAVEKAKKDGYVQTLFDRRRYLPELTATNHITRAFGERVARNAPIQGTAADIIKIAMVRVRDRLKNEGLSSRLILQVHDELIVEAPESEAKRAAEILREEMENAVVLSVPLIADANIGKTWYDAKG